jgi:hypothetical protein
MTYSITCDGLPVGIARIVPLFGLAHGELQALPAYEHIRYHAIAAGLRIRNAGIWDAIAGDFAEELARGWEGGRLALNDALGVELAVASIVIIDWEQRAEGASPRVVVDVRPDMARVEAFLRTIRPSGDDKSRPAA